MELDPGRSCQKDLHPLLYSMPLIRWGLRSGCSKLRMDRSEMIIISCNVFPECVARVPVSLGGLGVRLCSPSFAFATATVRNRPQPSATVRNRLRDRRKALHSGECVRSGPESVSN